MEVLAQVCGPLGDLGADRLRLERPVAQEVPPRPGHGRSLDDCDPGGGVQDHEVRLGRAVSCRVSLRIELAAQRCGVAVTGPLQPDRHLVGEEVPKRPGHLLQVLGDVVAAGDVLGLEECHGRCGESAQSCDWHGTRWTLPDRSER